MDPESQVVLHPLTLHREDGEVLVGRPDTDVFVALPELGAEIITMLGSGLPIGAIGDRLRAAHGADVRRATACTWPRTTTPTRTHSFEPMRHGTTCLCGTMKSKPRPQSAPSAMRAAARPP